MARLLRIAAIFHYCLLSCLCGAETTQSVDFLPWDPAFRVQLTRAGQVRTVLVQSDGSILIQGEFQWVGTTPRNGIARLHPDGSLDEFYDPGSELPGKPLAMALLPDGRHLVGASVGWNEVRLFCFDSRGNLDPSFGNATAIEHRYDEHLELLPLPDGHVLVGGLLGGAG